MESNTHQKYRGSIYYEMTDNDTVNLVGWVARDKDGTPYLFGDEPERQHDYGFWDDNTGHIELPITFFPSLTWEDEPKRVRITIETISE